MLLARRAGELLPCAGRLRCGSVRMSVTATAPATEAMWSELHARMRAFVARRVPDRAAADDLAQDIILRLYTHMGRLREHERLDAWAYQIARNAIADYWRERAVRRELPFDQRLSDQLASLPELEPDRDVELLRGEIASCLAPMVELLADPYRQAIRLTDLGKQTQSQAAADLGLSVPGMKARVQRGRAQLRELLRACCQIELDGRGQITEFAPNAGSVCGCAASSD